MENDKNLFTVIVETSASDKIYKHFEFLARVSENATKKLLDKLLNDISNLEQMPYRNPVYEQLYFPIGKYRYMISSERYLVIYQVSNNIVYIDDIRDCRQEANENFFDTGQG